MDNAIAYAGSNIQININCFREDENFYYFSLPTQVLEYLPNI